MIQSLLGEWSLQRTIYSFGGDLLGTFAGRALYKEMSPHLLHYREEGVLNNQQCESCAFKDYYFLYKEGVEVYFDLKLSRFFHKMEFNEGNTYPFYAKGIHHCGEDIYSIEYAFISEDEYKTAVSVKGPRKNYIITSGLRRKFKKI